MADLEQDVVHLARLARATVTKWTETTKIKVERDEEDDGESWKG